MGNADGIHGGGSGRHSLPVAVAGWFVSIAASLFFLLLLAEIFLRLFLPRMDVLQSIVMPVDDARSYVLRPGSHVIFSGMYEPLPAPVEWRVDERGLRAAVRRRREVRYRIALHGDSEAFGWGVPADGTLAARMEELDPSLKVLNRGVPGYNIDAIVAHLRATVEEDRPDLVIYLMNKNDYYDSLTHHPLLGRLRVWMAANFLLYRLRAGGRKAWRRSPAAAAMMVRRITAMRDVANRAGAAFMVALLHRKYRAGLPALLRRASPLPADRGVDEKHDGPLFPVAFDLEPVVGRHGRIDHHLTAPALMAAARAICGYLGRGGGSCRPEGGTVAGAHRGR